MRHVNTWFSCDVCKKRLSNAEFGREQGLRKVFIGIQDEEDEDELEGYEHFCDQCNDAILLLIKHLAPDTKELKGNQ